MTHLPWRASSIKGVEVSKERAVAGTGSCKPFQTEGPCILHRAYADLGQNVVIRMKNLPNDDIFEHVSHFHEFLFISCETVSRMSLSG